MKRIIRNTLLILIFCTHSAVAFEEAFHRLAENSAGLTDTERMQQLYSLYWEFRMEDSPEEATFRGFPGQNHRWTDYSLDAVNKRKISLQWPLAVLSSIDAEQLNEADRLNHLLLERELTIALEGSRFYEELMPINPIAGIQRSASQLINNMPNANQNDYRNILARLEKLPEMIDQIIVLMNIGMDKGITPPRAAMLGVAAQLDGQIDVPVDQHPMMQPFRNIPESTEQPLQLIAAARTTIKERVIPSFDKLRTYLQQTYLPGTRTAIACQDLPDGEAWYRYNVKQHTTTDLSPQEIHKIGLAEVKLIRSQMDRVIKRTGFEGSFGEFIEFLRTDSSFYYDTPDDLMMAYRDIAKRIDPELTRLFGRLPRLTYGVIPIPDYYAKSETTARYMTGSPEAGRPGYFMANTYDLKSRPKWEMEALTIHEAVPGHHIQLSIAQEIPGLPDFRRHAGYTAFVEGWALYAEKLGEEIGFYRDPYSKFGQLTYQMWRAVRLVVDTGMHSMGWSRQEAIDYFKANSSKPEHDIVVEIDRYIVWPGQALAYKIGEMKITELRDYAGSRLGDRFDLREFHDQILGRGALPLSILDELFREWVERKNRGS